MSVEQVMKTVDKRGNFVGLTSTTNTPTPLEKERDLALSAIDDAILAKETETIEEVKSLNGQINAMREESKKLYAQAKEQERLAQELVDLIAEVNKKADEDVMAMNVKRAKTQVEYYHKIVKDAEECEARAKKNETRIKLLNRMDEIKKEQEEREKEMKFLQEKLADFGENLPIDDEEGEVFAGIKRPRSHSLESL